MIEWLPIIQGLGIPTTILFGLGYGLWRSAPWAASKVEQVVARHLAFVDQVEKNVVESGKSLRELVGYQAELAKEMGQGFSRLTESNIRLTDRQTALTDIQIKATEKISNGH